MTFDWVRAGDDQTRLHPEAALQVCDDMGVVTETGGSEEVARLLEPQGANDRLFERLSGGE